MRTMAFIGAFLAAVLSASPALATVDPVGPPLALHPPVLLGALDAAVPSPARAAFAPPAGNERLHSVTLLVGLSLIGTGLIAGGAGFAVLYVCPPSDGFGCDDPATRTIGWVLAAPGIIPLAVGAILFYIAVESDRHRYSERLRRPASVAFSVAPIAGGGAASATVRF